MSDRQKEIEEGDEVYSHAVPPRPRDGWDKWRALLTEEEFKKRFAIVDDEESMIAAEITNNNDIEMKNNNKTNSSGSRRKSRSQRDKEAFMSDFLPMKPTSMDLDKPDITKNAIRSRKSKAKTGRRKRGSTITAKRQSKRLKRLSKT